MRKIIILLILIIVFNLQADFNFARELYEDSLYDEAINEFEMIVKLYPTSIEAENSIFLIAESYRKQGIMQLAEINYKRLLEGYPQNTFKDKVLYSLASVQFQQLKYQEAKKNFNSNLNNYPLSEFTKMSLELYLKCFFELEEHNSVIEKGNQLLKDYPNNSNTPSLLLLMTRSYLHLNSLQEAIDLIDRIYTEFPNNNAKWDAIIIETELLIKEKGLEEAVSKLDDILKNEIPRNYEEIYRLMLSKYYIELENFMAASEHLNILIGKFNHSDKQDEFLVLLTLCRLKMGNYHDAVSTPENPKIILNSTLYDEYLIYKAEAHFHLEEFEMTYDLLNNIASISIKENIKFQAQFLKARTLERTGRWIQAIDLYIELIDTPLAENEILWLRIGNIYNEKISDYNKAIKFYNLIINGHYPINIQNEALYLKALCYERIENYHDAILALDNIDLDAIEDKTLRSKIQRKRTYLRKFKQQNFEKAFADLLTSIYSFLGNNDERELKYQIIDIISSDLKNFEQGNDLLDETIDQREIYLKALINLKLAEKYLIENNGESAREHLDSAFELAALLDPSEYEEEIREISLKNQVLREQDRSEIVVNLENFITKYPNSPAVNEFLVMIIEYYREIGNESAMVKNIILLKQNETINELEFFKNKIWLAEYYYQQNNDREARVNYELAENYIDISQPDVLFHYSVTLDQTGNEANAQKKLEFLINNSDNFKNYNSAVEYYVELLIENGEFNKAANYYSYIKESDRNDTYYLKLSEIYLAQENKIKAKEALLHIVNKDDKTLESLALLQYETDDLEMAKYSYSLLKDRNNSNLKYYEMLGMIAYLQEKFLDCAENYKVVIDAIGEDPVIREGLERIVRENIISLYRIENRPKAELLGKRYKDILTDNDKNVIKLNEGIYYLEINEKKAEKIFGDLIKRSGIEPDLKYESYFWRGVSRLRLKKLDEAEADFTITLESSKQDLKNQADMKLGTLNFSKEKYQEALEHYYSVIENDETGKLALDAATNFAFVCKTIEEWQKAVAAYEIILERWSDAVLEGSTIFDIAFCHFRDKRYPDAIEMFNEALPLLTERELQAEAQYWISEAWFNMADYEKAVTEFLKVSYNYNDFVHWAATAELKAGEAYTQADDLDKAKRMYERIISKYGEISQWGKEAKLRLAVIGSGN